MWPCLFPACLPSLLPSTWQEVYSRPEVAGTFDAVVTCFFIDTAHNILEYLEVIHKVLRPGGFWLHMGPLLWHWADGSSDELSIELSLADVQQAALLMGFKPLHQEFVDAAYIGEVQARSCCCCCWGTCWPCWHWFVASVCCFPRLPGRMGCGLRRSGYRADWLLHAVEHTLPYDERCCAGDTAGPSAANCCTICVSRQWNPSTRVLRTQSCNDCCATVLQPLTHGCAAVLEAAAAALQQAYNNDSTNSCFAPIP